MGTRTDGVWISDAHCGLEAPRDQACAFFAPVPEPLLVSKPVEQQFGEGGIGGGLRARAGACSNDCVQNARATAVVAVDAIRWVANAEVVRVRTVQPDSLRSAARCVAFVRVCSDGSALSVSGDTVCMRASTWQRHG